MLGRTSSDPAPCIFFFTSKVNLPGWELENINWKKKERPISDVLTANVLFESNLSWTIEGPFIRSRKKRSSLRNETRWWSALWKLLTLSLDCFCNCLLGSTRETATVPHCWLFCCSFVSFNFGLPFLLNSLCFSLLLLENGSFGKLQLRTTRLSRTLPIHYLSLLSTLIIGVIAVSAGI